MARTALPVTDVPADYATAGVAVAFTAADSVNGNKFALTGREILIVQNSDASSHTVTIASVADSQGRTGDITADSIAAGAFRVYQQFPLAGWMQAADGQLYVNADDATVKFAVLRLRS